MTNLATVFISVLNCGAIEGWLMSSDEAFFSKSSKMFLQADACVRGLDDFTRMELNVTPMIYWFTKISHPMSRFMPFMVRPLVPITILTSCWGMKSRVSLSSILRMIERYASTFYSKYLDLITKILPANSGMISFSSINMSSQPFCLIICSRLEKVKSPLLDRNFSLMKTFMSRLSFALLAGGVTERRLKLEGLFWLRKVLDSSSSRLRDLRARFD